MAKSKTKNRNKQHKPPVKKEIDRSIATKGIGQFFFLLVQWTWGMPVNLIGAIVFLIVSRKNRWEKFNNAYICYIPGFPGGLSLGLFIFMDDNDREAWTKNTRIHEYGHTIQCLLLGPLYWIIIALPSAVWCNFFKSYITKNNVCYYKLYCVSWANKWGQKWSGLKQYGLK